MLKVMDILKQLRSTQMKSTGGDGKREKGGFRSDYAVFTGAAA